MLYCPRRWLRRRPNFCVGGSLGQAVAEVDLEREQGCPPVPRSCPRRHGVGDREVDQFPGGLLVGKVSFCLGRLPQLSVQGFDRLRRVHHATQLGRKCEKRDRVLPGVQPRLRDHREAGAPLLVERLERCLGGVGVDGGVDRFQAACDQRAGRTVKFDLRVAPEEKIRWAEAASTLGLSASEFVRDVANSAASEVLAGEPISVS